jgi:prepilin-type N-terminal cleavage/methylation domain-containing protein
MRSARLLSRGFTLLELLIVIAIILLVSVLTLPTIVSGLSHRQVSESARILQAALAGARDAAIRNNAPSGIRLLPDPVFNGINTSRGQLDPTAILAANRIIPIDPAPAYNEGRVSISILVDIPSLPYPGDGGGYYPVAVPGGTVIVLEECPFDLSSNAPLPNSPTSWFWNIRIGDQIRINNVGPLFTVVGPLNQTAAQGNSELFVNVGPPGTQSPLARLFFNGDQAIVYYPDFLFLVNGLDDNQNGWTDEGWDGVDNNGNGLVDELAEWELEDLPQSIAGPLQNITNLPYVVRRRPAPSPNAREMALPSQVVVDLTTWNTTRERSRLPVNLYTGAVDIMVNPDGSVMPTTLFSTMSSVGLASAFLHFWLAERSDLAQPRASSTAPLLPLPQGLAPTLLGGLELKGEYRLVTVFGRTGLITTNENPPFDTPSTGPTGTSYNANLPYIQAQQGVSGGH